MRYPLVPVHEVEIKIKPEKIYAGIFVIPHFAMTVLMAAWSIRYSSNIFLITSLVFAFLGWYKYLLILSASYYLTIQQLIITKGVFARSTNYLELYRIKDILVNQPFWMKAFGLMNMTLLSFDTAESLLILKGISVSSLPQSIRNHVQECRQRNKVLTVDN